MKKTLIAAFILACTTSSVSASDEISTINAITQEDITKALISIKEQNKPIDINTYNQTTVFDGNIIPDLDDVEENLDFNSQKKGQLHSAKKISEKLNKTLKEQKEEKLKIQAAYTGKVITVDDCVKIALANHPAIVSSKSSAEIYKSKIAQAWADYFPQVGLGIEYSRNNMLLTTFNSDKQRYNLFYMPTANVNMLLFDFGKTKSNVDIAKKTYLASEDNVQQSINDVIFNVKKCYYNLLYAMQQENVYTESVNDYTIHLEQAKAFYQIGTKAKIDVLTAEYNLGKAKLDLIKVQNSVKLAYANLNNAMGVPEFSDYLINEDLETRKYNVLIEDMLETAFKTRPEYLAAQKKAESSKLLVKATKRAFLPDLKAFGSFQYGGITPGADVGYQVGANLAYSNFNALLLKKQIDEAKSTAKKDIADLELTRQRVYLEVKEAYLDLQNAKDSIPVATLAMVEAKEQYELASGRYKVGIGDAIELKDAENTYRQAQLEYYANLMNYNIFAASLERVIGSPIKTEINEVSEKT